jgi:phage terminase large subunit-like protein
MLENTEAETKEWFNRFKDGCMSADSDQRSRPSMSRNADVIDKVRTVIMEDCHLTVREIAHEAGIS